MHGRARDKERGRGAREREGRRGGVWEKRATGRSEGGRDEERKTKRHRGMAGAHQGTVSVIASSTSRRKREGGLAGGTRGTREIERCRCLQALLPGSGSPDALGGSKHCLSCARTSTYAYAPCRLSAGSGRATNPRGGAGATGHHPAPTTRSGNWGRRAGCAQPGEGVCSTLSKRTRLKEDVSLLREPSCKLGNGVEKGCGT